MAKSIAIHGATDSSGARFIVFTQGGMSVCVSVSVANKGNAAVRTALSERGIFIGGENAAKSLFAELAGVNDFSNREIAAKVGWNGAHFALPDGIVYGAKGPIAIPVAYPVQPICRSKDGSAKAWRKTVAKRLTGQSIPMFLLMSMFAPAILRLVGRQDNFGFELMGAEGIGKSTLHSVAASAVGRIGLGDPYTYIASAQRLLATSDDILRQRSDLPIIVEGLDALPTGGSASSLEKMHAALVTKLVNGVPSAAGGQRSEECHKVGFSFTGNEPLADLLRQPPSDGLITIAIQSTSRFGVFESLPKGVADGASFAHELLSAAETNYGWAFDAFIRQLVHDRAKDADALIDRLQGWIDQFIIKVAVSRNDGRRFRNAQAFAIVYAAGRLAQAYGVLPKCWEPGPAAKAIYDAQSFDNLSPPVPFEGRLIAITRDDRVAIGGAKDFLPKGKLAIVRPAARGGLELIVPKENIEKLLPDWPTLKRSKAIDRWIARDDEHITVKRRIGKKGQTRVICFKLPAAD